MILIDTHTHLYLEHFDDDRQEVVRRAIDNDVKYMLLPNIDSKSIEPMKKLVREFPLNLFPMIGLHPTSVKADFQKELVLIEEEIKTSTFYAIGETGIDLYWDTTYEQEQKESLRQQIVFAYKYNLPIVIHSRNALKQIIDVLNEKSLPKVRGVFHCYPGDADTALEIVSMGYLIGIGGTLTYNKTELPAVIEAVGLKNILLETDAPFLPPVPFRGKRNESQYVKIIASKVAEIMNLPIETIAEKTTENAFDLFKIGNSKSEV